MTPPWDQLAERCGLTLTAPPRPLSGGFLHRMFALETRQGRFAVKLLNPAIMRRPDALDSYRRAEGLETRLEDAGLPILPALRVKGTKLQEMDGQYFYLFDYFDGRPLLPGELIPARTEAIGRTLATLHTVHRRPDSTPLPKPENDWPRYAALLSSREPSLHAQLTGALPLLTALEQRAREALDRLPPLRAICHGDMDCKNVLWQGDTFRIIDLECLDYGSPALEMMQLALCWSGLETCQLDFALLDAFLDGYGAAGRLPSADWATLYDSDATMLEWLAYNLRRVLGIGCDPGEREMGRAQCAYALRRMRYAAEARDAVLAHCAART